MIRLFTHTDLDGIGCAILAKLGFGNNIEISYCDYNDINEKVTACIQENNEDTIYITDISVSKELALEIEKSELRSKFCLLDHHPTALELNQFDWCHVKIDDESTGLKTCGTELFYKYLVDKGYLKEKAGYKRFVGIIRDYDTWRWAELGDKGQISKQVNDLFQIYGREEFVQRFSYSVSLGIFPDFDEIDKELLWIRQKEIDAYVEEKSLQMTIHKICGQTCGIVFADRFVSELGNRLCILHPEIDFVAMIDISDGCISYRTVRDDLDLGNDIAKPFGGGGHAKAAGSQFPSFMQENFIKMLFGEYMEE